MQHKETASITHVRAAGKAERAFVESPSSTLSASPRVRPVAFAVGVCAFSLFLASSLLVFSNATAAFNVSHQEMRVAKIAAYFLMAFLCLRHAVRIPRLTATALGLNALSLLFAYAPSLVPLSLPPNGIVIAYEIAMISGGVAEALITLLFLQFISLCPPKYSSIGISLAIAGSHTIFLLSTFLPDGAIFWLKPTLLAVTPFLLLYCQATTSVEAHASAFAHRVNARKRNPSLVGAKSDSFQIIFGAFVFPFLFALIDEVGVNVEVSLGLFNETAQVVGIVVLLILSTLLFFRYDRINVEVVFAVILSIFATAMLLLPLFWGNEILLSSFMIKCGYLLFKALLWSCFAKLAYENKSLSFFYFGIATGVVHLFILLGHATGFGLYAFSLVNTATIANVSLVAIWILAMSSLLFFFLSHRRSNALLQDGKSEAMAMDPSEAPPFPQRCRTFAEEFGLSERELEVVTEFAHGRSSSYIATKLCLSAGTVKTYIKRIYAKANIHSRQELLDVIESMSR